MMQPFTVDLPVGCLHGLRWGTPGNVPVLALHGWMDNAASFIPLAAHLSGLDLIALDLPGHGRSPHLPVDGEYTLHAALHVVLDVADALGWERFGLIGHSMGAGISCLLAAACPQRVGRLVLIDGLPLPDVPERTVPRMRESVAAVRSRNGSSPLRVFPDLDTPIQARMQANALDEASARLLVERGVCAAPGGHVWSSDPRLMLPSFRYLALSQVEALLAGIECPTRVIFADATPMLPRAQKRALARLIRHGEIFELSGIHHVHMQRPAEVAALAGGFLRGK